MGTSGYWGVGSLVGSLRDEVIHTSDSVDIGSQVPRVVPIISTYMTLTTVLLATRSSSQHLVSASMLLA